jgi:hypothetical protein
MPTTSGGPPVGRPVWEGRGNLAAYSGEGKLRPYAIIIDLIRETGLSGFSGLSEADFHFFNCPVS